MIRHNNTIRFQVVAPGGRSSDVWRIWNAGDDVYLAPRAKGGDFKISLHHSGTWRLAFTSEYSRLMHKLGTWDADRCLETIERPAEHATGFTRAVWMYFPDSELRISRSPQQRPKPIVQIPGPPGGGIRNVNVIFTAPQSRFTKTEPPLQASLGATPLASWSLSNGETLWVVHFELGDLRGLDREAEWFRANLVKAKKLDSRTALGWNDPSGRIMIAGTNNQGWFCVIDAAMC